MKKILLSLLTLVSISILPVSCKSSDDNGGDYDTIADVYEFTASFDNQYQIYNRIPTTYTSDHILIYRLSGINNNGNDVWTLIPKTYYLGDVDNNGTTDEISYEYDFSIEDCVVYVNGTYNLELTPEFLNNQTFRIVVIPGQFMQNYSNSIQSPVDFNDYHAVIKYYNIDESKTKIIKAK